MGRNLTEKIIAAHLISGSMVPGEEAALRIDQTLTQDATGTMAYLEFEAIGIDRVRLRENRARRLPRLMHGLTVYDRIRA